MTLHRYAARRDANENELLEVAEKLGARIVIAGPLDGWAGHRGKWVPFEIKTAHGRYTLYQQGFLKRCLAHQLPVWTWRTVDDVLASLGAK